jgi:hypothetical protein
MDEDLALYVCICIEVDDYIALMTHSCVTYTDYHEGNAGCITQDFVQ